MRSSMKRARSCDVGRVPDSSKYGILGAIRQYLNSVSAPWDFGVYNDLSMHKKADCHGLVKLVVLLTPLVHLQPLARILPTSLSSAIEDLLNEDKLLNTTGSISAPGIPNSQFASSIARRMVVILYHFRRIARHFDDEVCGLTADEVSDLRELCSMHLRATGARPHSKHRELKPHISIGSTDSDGDMLGAALGLTTAAGSADRGRADHGPPRDAIQDNAACSSRTRILPPARGAIRTLMITFCCEGQYAYLGDACFGLDKAVAVHAQVVYLTVVQQQAQVAFAN